MTLLFFFIVFFRVAVLSVTTKKDKNDNIKSPTWKIFPKKNKHDFIRIAESKYLVDKYKEEICIQ